MDQYTFEGTTYNVAPSRLEEFKQKFPQATKIGGELEQQKPEQQSSWFDQAMNAGAINADLYDNADAIFDIGNTKNLNRLLVS
jgi:hypothetical protein